MPDVNLDEILASLDADTRQYLDLLVNGAGQGLKGPGGNELARLLERFEPTHRDLARLNQVVSERGADLRQLVHSLQRAEHGAGRQAARRSCSWSTRARRCSGRSRTPTRASAVRVADLPGTLSQTTATLAQGADVREHLAPATRNLLPAISEIPAANAATIDLARPITPICRTEIRPFVVAARPVVRNLRPASINLATATPNLLQGVRRAQPPVQHARLLPGQHRARLPVVAGVARPQRAHAVLDAGRQRRLPPAVPPGQLRFAGADRAGHRRRGGDPHRDRDPDEHQPLPEPGRRQRERLLAVQADAGSRRGQRPQLRDGRDAHDRRQGSAPLLPQAPHSTDAYRQPPVSRIITMVLFALSCVGLLLFLWLSFGGTIPFDAAGLPVQGRRSRTRQDLADPGGRADRGGDRRQGRLHAARSAGQPDDGDDPDGQPVRADPPNAEAILRRRRSSARPTCS